MNAKTELIAILMGMDIRVKCASITFGDDDDDDDYQKFSLKVGYSDKEYNNFMDSLDFNYDDGFGGQELFGLVWFVNDSWLERYEYDGAEMWVYKRCPAIPIELI